MLQRTKNFLFSNQAADQTIFKNTFWLAIGGLIGRLLRIGVVIYAARILGAEGYGIFSYALALTTFLALFADLGISFILTRELSSKPKLRVQYLSTAFLTEGVLLVIIAILIVGILPALVPIPGATVLFPLMALLIVLDGLRALGFSLVRAVEQMELEAGINTLSNLATLVAVFILLHLNPTPYTLAVVYITGSALGLLAVGFALRRYLSGLLTHYHWQLMKSLLSSAWPFAVVSSLGAILTYVDTIMLGWLRTPAEVGFYSAAQKPVQFLLLIPGVIATGIFPALSRLAQRQDSKQKSVLEQTLALSFLLALPFTLGLILLNGPLTLLLYGLGYQASAEILRWLALLIFITFPSVVVSYLILAHDLHKRFIPHVATGAIMNSILNLYFIPKWGAPGAAIATVTSQLLIYLWMYYTAQKYVGFTMAPKIQKIIVATIIMGGAIMAFRWLSLNLYWITALAIFVYFLTLWFLKEPLLERIVAMAKYREGYRKINMH